MSNPFDDDYFKFESQGHDADDDEDVTDEDDE